MSTTMYAIGAKVDGGLKYINKTMSVEFNVSNLQQPVPVYSFGPLGDDTVIAGVDDWSQYFMAGGIKELLKYMTDINFTNFKAAFIKVTKTVKTEYETKVCIPFIINELATEDQEPQYDVVGMSWDSFCS